MQGSTPFRLPLTEYPLLSPPVTDTATPVQAIPVYYFHSVEQPFCRDTTCKCHWKQREVKRLLGSILDGEVSLRETSDLLRVEHKEVARRNHSSEDKLL